MGHSRASKRVHHEEIVGVAASRFREDGIGMVGVADVMHDAGLTHGGFYRHFESRDELVAEAVERALHDGGQAMAAVAESPRDPLAAVIDAYLSVTHRDNLGTSCAVTTLAGDVARSNPRARAAYTDQVGVYIDMLMRLLPSGTSDGVGQGRSPPYRRWLARCRWPERSTTRHSHGRSSPRRRRS